MIRRLLKLLGGRPAHQRVAYLLACQRYLTQRREALRAHKLAYCEQGHSAAFDYLDTELTNALAELDRALRRHTPRPTAMHAWQSPLF